MHVDVGQGRAEQSAEAAEAHVRVSFLESGWRCADDSEAAVPACRRAAVPVRVQCSRARETTTVGSVSAYDARAATGPGAERTGGHECFGKEGHAGFLNPGRVPLAALYS